MEQSCAQRRIAIRPFALLPKFEAGKPGGKSGSDMGFGRSLPEFSGRRNPVASAGLTGGNPVASAGGHACCHRGIDEAILCPAQDCRQSDLAGVALMPGGFDAGQVARQRRLRCRAGGAAGWP